jgi:hypothetical protein
MVYTGLKDQNRYNPVHVNSTKRATGFINEGDLQRIIFQRQDITIIIGSFLGNLNILIGLCSILFLSINRHNIKLKISRCLYNS